MVALATEKVLDVRHWNDTLFSFRTTRDAGLRFQNGHFVMIGLPVDGRPLMRAYSIASANYEEHLEFFSIKVQNGRGWTGGLTPVSPRFRYSDMRDFGGALA